jgi:phosphoribosylpyrophosphate synthetase
MRTGQHKEVVILTYFCLMFRLQRIGESTLANVVVSDTIPIKTDGIKEGSPEHVAITQKIKVIS